MRLLHLHDADYGRNRDRDGEPTKAFEPSLFVWATVMSRPAEDRAIVDAGLKALAFVRGRRWSATSRDLRARFQRARQARCLGRHQPARARRQDPADPRPLRPDRQPLRLVRRHPQQPRRTALAAQPAAGCIRKPLRRFARD
jgi:D-serine deaminase-like pyridoxal phosphate-dependent protein